LKQIGTNPAPFEQQIPPGLRQSRGRYRGEVVSIPTHCNAEGNIGEKKHESVKRLR
jgi:hypothetical protein